MSDKRKVEVFVAGCPVCDETVKLIERIACPSCDVQVVDTHEPKVAERAKTLGIRSLPAVLGKKGALRSSAVLHFMAFLSLALWCVMQGNGWLPWLILGAIGLLLIWEQRAADHVELAFYRINSWLGFVVLALVWSGVTGGWRWTISP